MSHSLLANKKRRWHNQVMQAASASDTTLGLPTELQSIHPCAEGLGLLKEFVTQPKSPLFSRNDTVCFKATRCGEPSLSTGLPVSPAREAVLIRMPEPPWV